MGGGRARGGGLSLPRLRPARPPGLGPAALSLLLASAAGRGADLLARTHASEAAGAVRSLYSFRGGGGGGMTARPALAPAAAPARAAAAAAAPPGPPAGARGLAGSSPRALISWGNAFGRGPGAAARTAAQDETADARIAAQLASFLNHEKKGVPAGAGVDGPQGFELGRMHRLLARLGDPQKAVPIIHVAGTKGKGSTSAFVAEILREAGYRVGTYTSPHLLSLRERISTGRCGAPIPVAAMQALLSDLAAPLAAAQAAEGGALTHFEVMTALALAHFARAGMHAAVLEAGLGGARDATNVAPAASTALSILTNVGPEHLEALGGSVESVARAKAGIARPGRPLLLGAGFADPGGTAAATVGALGGRVIWTDHLVSASGRPGGAASGRGGVYTEACELMLLGRSLAAERGASAAFRAGGAGAGASGSGSGSGSELAAGASPWGAGGAGDGSSGGGGGGGGEGDVPPMRLGPPVPLQMPGAHQRANAATAAAAALLLRAGGWFRISDAAIRRGLGLAFLPGRFQVIPLRGATLVLDGAHTPASAAALADTLRRAFPSPLRLGLVVAMAADKDHRGFAEALTAARPHAVVLAQAPVASARDRAAEPAALAEAWRNIALLPRGPAGAAAGGTAPGAGSGPPDFGSGGGALASGFMSRATVPHRLLTAGSIGAGLQAAVAAVSTSSIGQQVYSSPAQPIVCVTGSLYAVAAALALLGRPEGAWLDK